MILFDESEAINVGKMSSGNITDRFTAWRNSDDIGYVMLSFAVIIEAIKDLFYGNKDEIEDASHFWLTDYRLNEVLEEWYSTRDLWLDVLGMNDIPPIVAEYLYYGRDPLDEDFQTEIKEFLVMIESLYDLMKVDYYYLNLNNED